MQETELLLQSAELSKPTQGRGGRVTSSLDKTSAVHSIAPYCHYLVHYIADYAIFVVAYES